MVIKQFVDDGDVKKAANYEYGIVNGINKEEDKICDALSTTKR